MPGDLTIHRLLMKMNEAEASDLHLKIGCPPALRIAALLHEINIPPLTDDQTRNLLMPIVPRHLEPVLEQKGGVDFSHTEGVGQRYRCSVFHAGGGLHAAI